MSRAQQFVVAVCVVVILGAAGAAILMSSRAAGAGLAASTALVERARNEGLTVHANSIVRVQPDIAWFDVGVKTQSKRAADAQNKADEIMQKVIAAVKKEGIAADDLGTTRYELRPSYRAYEDRRTLIGYHCDDFITVRCRSLDRIGAVIDAAVAAGATDVTQADFRVDDIGPYRRQAREAAVSNARQRASQIAAAMGVKLGEVSVVRETTSDYRSWWSEGGRREALSQAVVEVPSPGGSPEEPGVALGLVPITASVSVTFELG